MKKALLAAAGLVSLTLGGAASLYAAAELPKNNFNLGPGPVTEQEIRDKLASADFAKHIEAFNPTFCKVLVRYNSEGDATLNKQQSARLKELSGYLHAKGRSLFMFELLVPPEKAQLRLLFRLRRPRHDPRRGGPRRYRSGARYHRDETQRGSLH